jgi:outer membrane immunogenic protein
MLRRLTLLGTASLIVIASGIGARAADLARPIQPAPAFAQPVVPAGYNWSGFYVGVNAGYGYGRSRWDDSAFSSGSGGFDINGALVGGQFGYNWQFGSWVLGLETDADWTSIHGSAAGSGAMCATNGNGQCQVQQNWFGTTRARAGYAFGRVLPYVTGGVAYGDRDVTLSNGTSSNSVNAGWTAGGGVEVGITPNWSAKAEYLHIDLGTASFFSAASGASTLRVPLKDDLVRAGVNYHW